MQVLFIGVQFNGFIFLNSLNGFKMEDHHISCRRFAKKKVFLANAVISVSIFS